MSAARFAPLLRSRVAVQTAPGFQAIRSISATAPCNKGPVDATKDTLKKADRTVSDAAVKGINTGESRQQAQGRRWRWGQASKGKGGEVKGEASEYAGKAKGEASEYAGKVKGETAEYAGKGKGKAEEALNEAKEKVK
ncbi:hypothetical protein N7519_011208 [Penicillium mononematosum]|uniref:uncharacterized protein n=1 Tax=Penicillium mononematosum TaxID=268346 RepID=UPI0025498EA6|nr:uncharacterized protein N7519_011208 [Penicillium mononematosum]KAJ6180747.1 hypothetical protein N7519_011208 [Penicillium mononematosum]